MNPKILVASLLGIMLAFTGCSPSSENKDAQTQISPEGTQVQKPLQVVTSFYPLFELATKVGGDRVVVKNIVPAGAEPHDYEPSPQDIISLYQADLVLYNGAGLEPWADKLIPELKQKGIQTLNQSEFFQKNLLHIPVDEISDEEKPVLNSAETPLIATQERDTSYYDPHFWLDPLLYRDELLTVEQKFSEADPQNQEYYQKNAEAYTGELIALHELYVKGLKECTSRFMVTNHAAFRYLAQRYHLEMVPINGISPESEPSANALAQLTQILKEKKVKGIFTETLLSPKIAETLALETGATTLVLNPLEGLSEEEIARGENYIQVMKENLKNLQSALECH